MADAIAGLSLLSPTVFAFMLLGVVVTQIVVIIPGLGAAVALAILLPFMFGLEPTAAIAMLVGAAVTSGTGNSVTGVLFGVPGSPTGVATIFDGYPMTKKGQGSRALAAALMASMVGGLLGAIVLAFMIPIVRPLILAFGPSEFFLMVIAALVVMASLGREDRIRGLISGFLGLFFAFVGQEVSTGVPRYTMGQLYLWDGLKLVPALIGLFAVAEMIRLMTQGGAIAEQGTPADIAGQRWQGILDVFREWRVTLQSSMVGVLIGLVPGLGGGTAQFVAYGQAVKTSKNPSEFGKGTVKGVIAADACTNSKEGGALVTTLAFAIPGSPTMAILLVALVLMGVTPGSEMLSTNLDITWMIVWVLVFANILAGGLTLLFSSRLARLSFVPISLLVAPVLAVSIFGSYATTRHVGDIWTALAFGLLGYAFIQYGYSRALLIIGMVLGPILEQNLTLAIQLYGWDFIRRPISIGLTVIIVVLLATPIIGFARRVAATTLEPVGADERDTRSS
ncbi:MAG: tripartite tricarboxylate transporter permease [Dehalococcoidia bacterium]